jgi:hypothetical protein
MNVIDLMARLNGEIVGHRIRAVIDGKIVILARLNGADWEYTPEGQELANKHSNEAAAEAEVGQSPRTRKAKDVPAEPVAVESADVEPEL